MRSIFGILIFCLLLIFTLRDVKKLNVERRYIADGFEMSSKLTGPDRRQAHCYNDHVEQVRRDHSLEKITKVDIDKLYVNAAQVCGRSTHVTVSLKMIDIGMATIYIPARATPGYEMMKALFSKEKNKQPLSCIDYVETILSICPVHAKQFIKDK